MPPPTQAIHAIHAQESSMAVVPKYDAFGRKYDVAMLSNYRMVVLELEHILKHIKVLEETRANGYGLCDGGEPTKKM